MDCGCRYRITHYLKPCPNVKKRLVSKSFLDTLRQISGNYCGDLQDFVIINDVFIFAFKDGNCVELVIIKFKSNSNKIILERSAKKFKYSLNGEFNGLIYDCSKKTIILLVVDRKKSFLYSIRWFDTLQSLSYRKKLLKTFEKNACSIGKTQKKIILTFEIKNSPKFNYALTW
jgi:hypothetical protein